MFRTLNTLLDICLLRAAPQDVPYSKTLLGILLGAHVLVGMLLAAYSYSGVTVLAYALTGTVMMLVLARALLILRQHAERFIQTISALAGTDVFIGLVVWPLTGWLLRADANGADPGIPLMLWGLVVIWSLAVTGHILRHALSVHIGTGLVMSLGYLIISYNVMSTLFPTLE